MCALLLLVVVAGVLPGVAVAEQASEPASAAAGRLDAGTYHTCALLAGGDVRCWGFGSVGQLGYGNTDSVGDDETPGSVGPVNLGDGRTAAAISAGDYHTCALLDDATVRCWGYGADGRLGYRNTASVGDDETPGSVGPVDLGPGRTAKAITAGSAHSCALLDDGSVRCWGFGGDFRLGRNSQLSIGDDETPGSVPPVNLGTGRTAIAITAGSDHTCALLDNGTVRCWGQNTNGQLGIGDTREVGDPIVNSARTLNPVDLGAGHTAVAMSAGGAETCAVLDDGNLRCWGYGGNGRLGYGNTNSIGDDETPGSVGPVDLGAGRTAKAISVGDGAACAVLDDWSVRCWGIGGYGQLGYGNTNDIGDNETPGSVGPVDLGAGRSAKAISVGARRTCARLDDDSVRCWGNSANGELGYCNHDGIGDDETPAAAGPVDLGDGHGGAACPVPPSTGAPDGASGPPPTPDGPSGPSPAPSGSPVTTPGIGAPQITSERAALSRAEAARARALRRCLARVASRADDGRRRARHASARRRATTRRNVRRHVTTGRRRCLRVYGRIPGRVTGLRAFAVASTVIELDFAAAGTNGRHPPPAGSYVIRQSRRPIRSARDFAHAQPLCSGSCGFSVTKVGDRISLLVTGLRPHTSYYYALVARDNGTGRCGPRSSTVKATTADVASRPSNLPPPRPLVKRRARCQELR